MYVVVMSNDDFSVIITCTIFDVANDSRLSNMLDDSIGTLSYSALKLIILWFLLVLL